MIYDITQPLFESVVFPGDPKPERHEICRIEKGDLYNLTAISLCAHNGTHIDAPFHFYREGKTIEQVSLKKCIGPAYVETHCGDVTGPDAVKMLERARSIHPDAYRRILIRGNAVVTEEAAQVFAQAGIDLIGNESQTVGPEDGPMAVHLILLKEEIVLLEGIRLQKVQDGVYQLYCLPLNLTGSDGSPCRAVLADTEENLTL